MLASDMVGPCYTFQSLGVRTNKNAFHKNNYFYFLTFHNSVLVVVPKINLMVLSVKSSGMVSTQTDHFLHPGQKPRILVGTSNVFLC